MSPLQGTIHMAGGKIIPIIERGDQAVRDDVYEALVTAAAELSLEIADTLKPLKARLDQLQAEVDRLKEGVATH
jgi:tRNA(Phe) wybutosine-synthesizing methylase Tyw3